MKSKWIEYNGKRVLYQDFSNNFFNEKAVIEELSEVQNLVTSQPENSVLILSNFSNTEITANLMPLLNESSSKTKSHVRKTAVLGITGVKRTVDELLLGSPAHRPMTAYEATEWMAVWELRAAERKPK